MRVSTAMVAVCVCAAWAVTAPAPARADTWFSPYLGSLFGGSANQTLSDAVDNRSDATYGFSVGGMGNGIAGGELDVGYTPGFLGSDGDVVSSRLMTVHGSLLLGIPVGGQRGAGIRPYAVVGLGMIQRRAELRDLFSNLSTNDFGYNVGFGVMAFFGDVFGLRGEYRYFRNFESGDVGLLSVSPGTFNVSRATAGIVLRF